MSLTVARAGFETSTWQGLAASGRDYRLFLMGISATISIGSLRRESGFSRAGTRTQHLVCSRSQASDPK